MKNSATHHFRTIFMRNVSVLSSLMWVAFINNPGFCESDKWQEQKSAHFFVYYRDNMVSKDYIERVVSTAEDCYRRITDDFGFSRYDFWLWEKRAKIYIYRDDQEYRKMTGRVSWSGGHVNVRDKVIRTYAWAEGFFDTLLPHELGHIIFREVVGFKGNVPLWLDEGVATLQEGTKREEYLTMVRGLAKADAVMPIEELSKINEETLFMPKLFYAESASIVDYLISQFGRDRFVRFCRALRDGKALGKALSSAYPFGSLPELNDAWMRHLQGPKRR